MLKNVVGKNETSQKSFLNFYRKSREYSNHSKASKNNTASIIITFKRVPKK